MFILNISWSQNILLKGKTVNYYNNKKVKGVQISIYNDDSLVQKILSNGNYKIRIQTKGILKVVFTKEGFIEKHFLINTKEIPKYYLDKKYLVKAEVSMTLVDKYMDINKINAAVGYVYFSKKYQGFIWDPEYTKRAQVAMDAIIFPLDEVVKLDSALNKSDKAYFFQKGINYYINIKTAPEQFFSESTSKLSNSKIKAPVQQGYYYGKFIYSILEEKLELANKSIQIVTGKANQYENLAQGIKDCKRLDTLILDNKYAGVGYWLNLINYVDTSNIIEFTNIAHTISLLDKQFLSIEMSDAELSFYSDFKTVVKAAEILYQRIKNSTKSEIKNPQHYSFALQKLKESVRILGRNNELTKD